MQFFDITLHSFGKDLLQKHVFFCPNLKLEKQFSKMLKFYIVYAGKFIAPNLQGPQPPQSPNNRGDLTDLFTKLYFLLCETHRKMHVGGPQK